jgi:hypothetical protein
VIDIFRFCRVENLESENVTVRARIGKAERTREMYRNGNLVVDRKKNSQKTSTSDYHCQGYHGESATSQTGTGAYAQQQACTPLS